jgi:hypothetical protein
MMRDDLPAAAVRLSASHTVHTHERIFYGHVQGSKLTPQVIVGDRRFRSRLAARKFYGIGAETLNDWLTKGKARFA